MPDLHFSQVHRPSAPAVMMMKEGSTVVAEPLEFEVHVHPVTEGYLEIRQRDGGKVITVLEFLSPANKVGGVGHAKYLEKQDEILRSDASLIEIDLVRTGHRVLALAEEQIPLEHVDDYLTWVSPGWRRSNRKLYPMPLRERLPVFAIPLRRDERALRLDLQALVNQVYSAGRYDDIDYQAKLDPPLRPHDATWANEILKMAGKF